MPLKAISAADAWSNLRSNREARWPGGDGKANRLEPVCAPGLRPSFHLRPAEKVFTIGSCFARNIERHLARLGYNLPGTKYVPKELVGQPLDGFMNKFSPQSMLNEVLWAFEPEAMPDPAETFLAQRDGTVIDGQLMSKINVSPERAQERRGEITDVFRIAAECRVVVITLGLVEAWFDTKTGIYLNRALPRSNALDEPDRFELHVLSYDELHAATDRLIRVLLRHGPEDMHIMLTVSPVPLMATFTEADVLCANTYSKSSLRTVAEHVVEAYDAVDYYPSFESVTLSSRQVAWREDLGHVQDDLVSLNVGRMAVEYARTPAAAEFAKRLIPETMTSRDGTPVPSGFGPPPAAPKPAAPKSNGAALV